MSHDELAPSEVQGWTKLFRSSTDDFAVNRQTYDERVDSLLAELNLRTFRFRRLLKSFLARSSDSEICDRISDALFTDQITHDSFLLRWQSRNAPPPVLDEPERKTGGLFDSISYRSESFWPTSRLHKNSRSVLSVLSAPQIRGFLGQTLRAKDTDPGAILDGAPSDVSDPILAICENFVRSKVKDDAESGGSSSARVFAEVVRRLRLLGQLESVLSKASKNVLLFFCGLNGKEPVWESFRNSEAGGERGEEEEGEGEEEAQRGRVPSRAAARRKARERERDKKRAFEVAEFQVSGFCVLMDLLGILIRFYNSDLDPRDKIELRPLRRFFESSEALKITVYVHQIVKCLSYLTSGLSKEELFWDDLFNPDFEDSSGKQLVRDILALIWCLRSSLVVRRGLIRLLCSGFLRVTANHGGKVSYRYDETVADVIMQWFLQDDSVETHLRSLFSVSYAETDASYVSLVLLLLRVLCLTIEGVADDVESQARAQRLRELILLCVKSFIEGSGRSLVQRLERSLVMLKPDTPEFAVGLARVQVFVEFGGIEIPDVVPVSDVIRRHEPETTQSDPDPAAGIAEYVDPKSVPLDRIPSTGTSLMQMADVSPDFSEIAMILMASMTQQNEAGSETGGIRRALEYLSSRTSESLSNEIEETLRTMCDSSEDVPVSDSEFADEFGFDNSLGLMEPPDLMKAPVKQEQPDAAPEEDKPEPDPSRHYIVMRGIPLSEESDQGSIWAQLRSGEIPRKDFRKDPVAKKLMEEVFTKSGDSEPIRDSAPASAAAAGPKGPLRRPKLTQSAIALRRFLMRPGVCEKIVGNLTGEIVGDVEKDDMKSLKKLLPDEQTLSGLRDQPDDTLDETQLLFKQFSVVPSLFERIDLWLTLSTIRERVTGLFERVDRLGNCYKAVHESHALKEFVVFSKSFADQFMLEPSAAVDIYSLFGVLTKPGRDRNPLLRHIVDSAVRSETDFCERVIELIPGIKAIHQDRVSEMENVANQIESLASHSRTIRESLAQTRRASRFLRQNSVNKKPIAKIQRSLERANRFIFKLDALYRVDVSKCKAGEFLKALLSVLKVVSDNVERVRRVARMSTVAKRSEASAPTQRRPEPLVADLIFGGYAMMRDRFSDGE